MNHRDEISSERNDSCRHIGDDICVWKSEQPGPGHSGE